MSCEPVVGLERELQLLHLRGGVADQVHPRAVAAVLRAGRQDLREHLGGVAVREALDGPHVVLVQGVAAGEGVRGPLDEPVAEDRQHVAADRVGAEGGRVRLARGGHAVGAGAGDDGVHHLRGQQHRHGRALLLVGDEVGVDVVGEQVAHDLLELRRVLQAVAALPLHVAPLLLGDVLPAGHAAPVRLDELATGVRVRLQADGRRGGIAHAAEGTQGPCACHASHARTLCVPSVWWHRSRR